MRPPGRQVPWRAGRRRGRFGRRGEDGRDRRRREAKRNGPLEEAAPAEGPSRDLTHENARLLVGHRAFSLLCSDVVSCRRSGARWTAPVPPALLLHLVLYRKGTGQPALAVGSKSWHLAGSAPGRQEGRLGVGRHDDLLCWSWCVRGTAKRLGSVTEGRCLSQGGIAVGVRRV